MQSLSSAASLPTGPTGLFDLNESIATWVVSMGVHGKPWFSGRMGPYTPVSFCQHRHFRAHSKNQQTSEVTCLNHFEPSSLHNWHPFRSGKMLTITDHHGWQPSTTAPRRFGRIPGNPQVTRLNLDLHTEKAPTQRGHPLPCWCLCHVSRSDLVENSLCRRTNLDNCDTLLVFLSIACL